jgi:hypothetical protein
VAGRSDQADRAEAGDGWGTGPKAALAALPRLLTGAREDIRTIAEGMGTLPELVRVLSTIETRVAKLEDDVVKMRRAVESMGGDVGALPQRLDELQDSIPLSRRRRARVSGD